MRALLVPILFVALSASPSWATSRPPTEPVDFVSDCRVAVNTVDKEFDHASQAELDAVNNCATYIRGMLDGYTVAKRVALPDIGVSICVPLGATPERVARRLVALVTEKPELLKQKDQSVMGLTLLSIASLYKCQS